MTRVKELYIGRTLEDLEERSSIPNVSSKKIKTLLETASKLFRRAEKFKFEGDEELAYIFYLRYFNLLEVIRKRPEYSNYKDTVKAALGGNTANKDIMDKLETLHHSLHARYARLRSDPSDENLAPKAAKIDHDRDYDDLSASEKFDRLKAGHMENAFIDSSENEQSMLRRQTVMPGKDLFDGMKNNSVLVMDCRPSQDYNRSHLIYSWTLNVPEEIIVAGMSAGKLQDCLDATTKVLWAARALKDHVVLMDWKCPRGIPAEHSPISILRDILQNWDPDVAYRSPIKVLEGGYEYFIMMYPTLCTNPTVQAPQVHVTDFYFLEEIEYPSIHDITMKDDIRDHGYSLRSKSANYLNNNNNSMENQSDTLSIRRPNIDRTSKMAAIKTYSEKKKPLTEIFKEREELLIKQRANDEQLKQENLKWERIYSGHFVEDMGSDRTTEQDVVYNIMQLESIAQDYKTESNRLQEELQKYRRLQRENNENLTPSELEKLEEITRKMEAEMVDRKRVEEEYEREKQVRERQLAIARENKRPTIGEEDDEEIVKPKIPQFDRSFKPQTPQTTPPTSPQDDYNAIPPRSSAVTPPPNLIRRSRNFSPVLGSIGRGLTGLKNLGNTCYMNSILQCLSNTPQFAEYCITNKYQNYISRTNKTRGEIVEEVAALIKVLWGGSYKCVASKDLRNVIGQYQQMFRGIQQQDSHEFLTILMDLLHSDLQTLSVSEKPRELMTASERCWLQFTKSKESLILYLFYGQIKSTVKCCECNSESATYESFSSLSLELPPNAKICYLDTCLEMYFSGEHIHGWNCPNCKQQRVAIKTLRISKLPPVLIVHLKRFHADPEGIGRGYKKKQNFVRFPLTDLEMTPHTARSELRSASPKTYQLYGVSNHYGSMQSGHYTSFCKSGNYSRWFKFDDQVVSPLDASNVVSSAAYILFYTWLPTMQIMDTN